MTLELSHGFEAFLDVIQEYELIMRANSQYGGLRIELDLRHSLLSISPDGFDRKRGRVKHSDLSILVPDGNEPTITAELNHISCTIEPGILQLSSALDVPDCQHVFLSNCVEMWLLWMARQSPQLLLGM